MILALAATMFMGHLSAKSMSKSKMSKGKMSSHSLSSRPDGSRSSKSKASHTSSLNNDGVDLCGLDPCGVWTDDGEWMKTGAKMTAIRLEYLGENRNDLGDLKSHLPSRDGVQHQSDDKLTIVGSPKGQSVRVSLSDKFKRAGAEIIGAAANNALISVGDIIEVVVQDKFPGDALFTLTDADGTNFLVGFHTSCSNPISIGDAYGSLLIVGWANTVVGDSADCTTPSIETTPSNTITTDQFFGTSGQGGDIASTEGPGDASAATAGDDPLLSTGASAAVAIGVAALAAVVIMIVVTIRKRATTISDPLQQRSSWVGGFQPRDSRRKSVRLEPALFEPVNGIDNHLYGMSSSDPSDALPTYAELNVPLPEYAYDDVPVADDGGYTSICEDDNLSPIDLTYDP